MNISNNNSRDERRLSSSVLNPISAAHVRFAARSNRRKQNRELTSEEYYMPTDQREETIEHGVKRHGFDAIVTRNHYGSLVLNARHALFMDIDVDISGPTHNASRMWSNIFGDLCTVLGNERNDGFRIYRTAAGFRVLSTAREFEPGSETSTQLMKAVGADKHFVELCGRQNSFRARLTAKPWRCGMTRPPFVFPRLTIAHELAFKTWLSQYEHRCSGRATCRFLAQVGLTQVNDRVVPIVDYHDRETKAHSNLPLA
jgi:hypothetical protein